MPAAGQTTSLFTSMGLAILLVAICVLIHYEALRVASVMLPRLNIRRRKRILFVMGWRFWPIRLRSGSTGSPIG